MRERLVRNFVAVALVVASSGCGLLGPRAAQGDITFCTVIQTAPTSDSIAYITRLNAAKNSVVDGRLEGLRITTTLDVISGVTSPAEAKRQLLDRCQQLGAL
jgi:hypothetical protein